MKVWAKCKALFWPSWDLRKRGLSAVIPKVDIRLLTWHMGRLPLTSGRGTVWKVGHLMTDICLCETCWCNSGLAWTYEASICLCLHRYLEKESLDQHPMLFITLNETPLNGYLSVAPIRILCPSLAGQPASFRAFFRRTRKVVSMRGL